jgi:hypothetical protein
MGWLVKHISWLYGHGFRGFPTVSVGHQNNTLFPANDKK